MTSKEQAAMSDSHTLWAYYRNHMRPEFVFIGTQKHVIENIPTWPSPTQRPKPAAYIFNCDIDEVAGRRLVAAWNACAGIETETLEKYGEEFPEVIGDDMTDRKRADEAERLLKEISEVPIHGPHLSAKDGFEAALRTIEIIRGKARAHFTSEE